MIKTCIQCHNQYDPYTDPGCPTCQTPQWTASVNTRLGRMPETPLPKEDVVNHPKHYTSGKIEVIEAIEDWKLSFHLGNAVKYIARAGKKDPSKLVEDLNKASWYIERAIKKLKESK